MVNNRIHIILLSLCLGSTISLTSQNIQPTLTSPKATPAELWQKVIYLDHDTSILSTKVKDSLARELWWIYETSVDADSSMQAAFYALATYLRINNYATLIAHFKKANIKDEYWRNCYLLYRKALLESNTEVQVIDSLINSSKDCDRRIRKLQYAYDIGSFSFFNQKTAVAQEYLEYFANHVGSSKKLERELRRTRGFLHALRHLNIGQKAPTIQAVDLHGDSIYFDINGVNVYLLDFWATWCGPCRSDTPMLQSMHDKYFGKGLRIIGISLDKKKAQLKDYIERNAVPWPQIHANTGRDHPLVIQYAGFALPTYILIDQNGIIRYNYFSREDGVPLGRILNDLFQERD